MLALWTAARSIYWIIEIPIGIRPFLFVFLFGDLEWNEVDSIQQISIPPKPNTACTDVDYKAIVYGVQLAIHFMRKNSTPGGKIVATASIAAVHPHSSYPEYCGAKAAV
jgi:hypothetical protein